MEGCVPRCTRGRQVRERRRVGQPRPVCKSDTPTPGMQELGSLTFLSSLAAGKLHSVTANLGYQLDDIWNHQKSQAAGNYCEGFP